MRRREFLGAGASATAAGILGCAGAREGEYTSSYAGAHSDGVAHLLPTASHDRLLIKASFKEPLVEAPLLLVDGQPAQTMQTDSQGRFFAFDATGLEPATDYLLEIMVGLDHQTEPWSLETLPAPGADASHLRIVVYTCAGGHDIFTATQLPTAVRRALLERALAFEPDVVIANGDHVYWDLTLGPTALVYGRSPVATDFAGTFDRGLPVLGTENETVLQRAVDNQIAELYGQLFRSIPVFFVRDDHDYFDNDVYEEPGGDTTLPPAAFHRELARTTQSLYYPEFLPAIGRPDDLPGAGASDRPAGVGEAFGTLRYGRLLEALLYDCKGYLSMGGDDAAAVPLDVERWLVARMSRSEATHVVNVPSTPPCYTAGKFAEWYPDVRDGEQLTTSVAKPGWQRGWLLQHDRLLGAASSMDRIPLFLAGDVHSHAESRIFASGSTDLSANPVHVVVAGTPGATQLSWPSFVRGVPAQPASDLVVEQTLSPLEENGFNLVDVEPDRITIRFFRYDGENEDPGAISGLQPFRETVLRR